MTVVCTRTRVRGSQDLTAAYPARDDGTAWVTGTAQHIEDTILGEYAASWIRIRYVDVEPADFPAAPA